LQFSNRAQVDRPRRGRHVPHRIALRPEMVSDFNLIEIRQILIIKSI